MEQQREIKFRAWCGETIGMEYNVVSGKFGSFYARIDPQDSACLNPTSIYYETVPIVQYTGLKDKNGKEIYEGDITNENRYFIFNRNGFWYKQINGDGNFPLVFWPENQPLEFEIIGNIFENPELLETLR